MNRRLTPIHNYGVLLLFVLCCLNLSPGRVIMLRGGVASLSIPTAQILHLPLSWGGRIFSSLGLIFSSSSKKRRQAAEEELLQLRQENLSLQTNLREILEILQQQQLREASYTSLSLERGVPARVTIRTPESWGTALWIDIGTNANEPGQPPRVALNSPVLCGESLVGLVDCVTARYSRVRLITDPSLVPSVRVARGSPQAAVAIGYIDALLYTLSIQPKELAPSSFVVVEELEQWKEQLLTKHQGVHLAKGELVGATPGHWYSSSHELIGVGFNYDFADAYGPARDLRTGQASPEDPLLDLIRKGDLLVTTGLDGVFPSEVHVAHVSRVLPLREGDSHYEVRAQLSCPSLDSITTLSVLPPRSSATVETSELSPLPHSS